MPSAKEKNHFRDSQKAILSYKSGLMGISAVPGSGKTFTLSHLAAGLVKKLSQRKKPEESEVLIVTFTNTAVNHLRTQLAGLVPKPILGGAPGYRIRTLHGLASDIIRERPALAGLSKEFEVVDEREALAIRMGLVNAWWRENGATFIRGWVGDRYQSKFLHSVEEMDKVEQLVTDVAERFISLAKDREQTPEQLRAEMINGGLDLPLAAYGLTIYERYQRTLEARGQLDFQDLSRIALSMLRLDGDFLKRLQKKWPFILEDEAQDSSQLQESILGLLSGYKNWVRVGDPNQAINTTFTTADPTHLNEFLSRSDATRHLLDEAGRSGEPILNLANELARWVTEEHPSEWLRDALTYQAIQLTSPADPAPNPPAKECKVFIDYEPGVQISTDAEIKRVVESASRFVGENPNKTVAILVPENERGVRFVEALRQRNLAYEELLSTTTNTRESAEHLYLTLAYLASPITYRKAVSLAELYAKVWYPTHLGLEGAVDEIGVSIALKALETLNPHPESLLFGGDSAVIRDLADNYPVLAADLTQFIGCVERWLTALNLPIDQLILIINQDLFRAPEDIALGFKFAALLRTATFQHPKWGLDEFLGELDKIRTNQRKFLGLELELGYQAKPNQVTVATIHQAKGLEWDRVYVTGTSNYTYPSLQGNDDYLDERYYIRGALNLKAEIAAQLDALIEHRGYEEGQATLQARINFAAERLRLLYVAITRAKRELMISWNTGRYPDRQANSASLPVVALHAYWKHD
jgi:DNA helicase-2/ATP-dependent DNA helicase PcrA